MKKKLIAILAILAASLIVFSTIPVNDRSNEDPSITPTLGEQFSVVDSDLNISTAEDLTIYSSVTSISNRTLFDEYLSESTTSMENISNVEIKIIFNNLENTCSIETIAHNDKNETVCIKSEKITDPDTVKFVSENAASLTNIVFIDRIGDSLSMIYEMLKGDLSFFGKAAKDKIEKFLASTIVKKIVTKLGISWIPGAGWISLGLVIYELYDMYPEIKEIYDLYCLERTGYEIDWENMRIEFAERYEISGSIGLVLASDSVCNKIRDERKETPYRAAFLNYRDNGGDGKIYITTESIKENAVKAIMNNPEGLPAINVYTFEKVNAEKGMKLVEPNVNWATQPTDTHKTGDMNFEHFHLTKKTPNSYGAHMFFGHLL